MFAYGFKLKKLQFDMQVLNHLIMSQIIVKFQKKKVKTYDCLDVLCSSFMDSE